MPYTYRYPRPAVTVDSAVFGIDQTVLKILLIQRAYPPFAGHWALPGGFVNINETLEHAAHRELAEETGLTRVRLEQLHTFGQPERDPRGRVISVVYFGLVNLARSHLKAGDDARRAEWFDWSQLPALAFDHAEILDLAYQRLVQKARWGPIGLEVLPSRFSLQQLQALYEVIFQRKLDSRKFRRKMLALGLICPSESAIRPQPGRTRLYRFHRPIYRQLVQHGFASIGWE